jgi:hypothetical protein
MASSPNPHLARFRRACLAFPGAHEAEAWGAPTFRVKKKLFAHYRNNHHGDGRIAAWCKSTPDEQLDFVEADPERFFVPPWLGRAAGSGCGSTESQTGRSSEKWWSEPTASPLRRSSLPNWTPIRKRESE